MGVEMPFQRITAQQFEAKLKAAIRKRDASADVTVGPIMDWAIRPQAAVLEGQQDEIRKLFNLLSMQNLNQLDPVDVDAFVSNERVFRSTGSAAFTTLTFARASKPASDLTVAANFPVATENDASTGKSVTFLTQQTATMLAASADAYFNPDTGRYELNISAASLNSGPSTKVGRLRVNKPLRPLPGFDSVTNKAESTGGLAAESNTILGDRYLLRIAGTDLSTKAGQDRLVRQVFSNVESVLVINGNNAALLRADTDAGAIDIYILGSSILDRTVTTAFPGKLNPIILDRQPATEVISVTSGITYVQGIDYDFIQDSTTVARSVRGKDAIVFRADGSAPAFGDPITISYRYDNLIIALQSLFGQPAYESQAADVLFKAATKIEVALSIQIKITGGDPDVILQGARDALLGYFNGTDSYRGLAQGASVERFDLDGILSRLGGIDNATYTLLARAGGSGVNDLPMLPNEYARLSVANLNITLG
jgi:hypothetical protein